VTGRSGGGSECAALWARAAIRDLEDRYAIGDPDASALIVRVVDLSRRFSVLSRFTAFLAVDRSEKVNPGGRQHRSVQPVEPASGWDMLDTDREAVVLDRAMPAPMPAGRPAPAGVARMVMSAAGLSRGAFTGAGSAPPSAGAPPLPPQVSPKPRRQKKEAARPSETPVARTRGTGSDEARRGATAAEVVDLVSRLREVAERLAQRSALHPGIAADAVLRDLDAMAGELSAARLGDGLVRLQRARHVLRALLTSGGAADELERELAEIESALGAVIAELESRGPTPGRRRDFWK
jgi:Ca-activated chloride channel family protein